MTNSEMLALAERHRSTLDSLFADILPEQLPEETFPRYEAAIKTFGELNEAIRSLAATDGAGETIRKTLEFGEIHGVTGTPSREDVAALLDAMADVNTSQPSIARTGCWIIARQFLAALTPPAPEVKAEDQAEQFIQAAIDSAPEPLRRLGEWLANKLDDDDWKTADRLITGAAVALVRATPPSPRYAEGYAAGVEAAAKVVEENIIVYSGLGNRLKRRPEGDVNGLEFAASIRALTPGGNDV